jgi:hypothetical protein
MDRTRVRVRYVAAAAATATSAIYYLIGLGVLNIGGSKSGEMVNPGVFGGGAGTAYLLLAVLLIFSDRRWIWVLALLAQMWVYLVYFAASAGREPAFELWGITLRLLQVPVLIALVYLSIKPAHRAVSEGGAK